MNKDFSSKINDELSIKSQCCSDALNYYQKSINSRNPKAMNK